ncbi:YqkE family protein [Paenibacillus cymbidii]|uniref:YqkE family protein n=1 Tax=Paenibacillus cymbidii TaxID=1639034 RepID=UPI001081E7C3|nr:YqkE family protein [Paenibacillus cymbidii]
MSPKKHRPSSTRTHAREPERPEQVPMLKDLLRPEVVSKLKAQADEMKAAEEQRKERARQEAEERRKAEQKRLENDFEYLLNNSSIDWKQAKK